MFPIHRLSMLVLRLAAGAALIMPGSVTLAATYLIQFGGSFGLNYSPKTLAVAVGDTIRWQGDFSSHPLSSTSVPAGAESFSNSGGTVFSYVVQFPGLYNYQCDVHFPSMSGSFTATGSTGVNDQIASNQPTEFRLDQNYPNPFNPSTRISYSLAEKAPVTLKVFNAIGEEVATLVRGVQEAGTHEAIFDASRLPTGMYLYRLEAGGAVATRRLLLVK